MSDDAEGSRAGYTWADRGYDLAEAGRHEEAVKAFLAGIAEGEEWLRFNLGNSLAALGRWDEAARQSRMSAEAGEDDAWFNLGEALEAQGLDDSAAEAYSRAADLGDGKGNLGLALAWRRAGDTTSARTELSRALASDSEEVRELARAIDAVWTWEDDSDAGVERTLRQLHPIYTPATPALAELLMATGRTDEALLLLKARCSEGDVDACLPLGNHLDAVDDDADGAERAFRQGIANGDEHCVFNLGAMSVRRRRRTEGLVLIEQARAAGDRFAADYLKKLGADEPPTDG